MNARFIKNKDEMKFDGREVVAFLGSIRSIENKGNETSLLPFRIVLLLEDSGEEIEAVGWIFPEFHFIEEGKRNNHIYSFTAKPAVYNDTKQIKILSIVDTEEESKYPKKDKKEEDKLREAAKNFYDLVKNDFYKSLIEKFILKNNNFFEWPAAYSFHHNYPGGLAKHSISVTNLSLKIANSYKSGINFDLLITSALLHDIGKMVEYKEDGTRTFVGNTEGHIYIGSELISAEARRLGLDPYQNPDVSTLISAVLSHHGKLEFGSPIQPKFIESLIISYADDIDSKMDSTMKGLQKIETGNLIKIPTLNYEIYKLKE